MSKSFHSKPRSADDFDSHKVKAQKKKRDQKRDHYIDELDDDDSRLSQLMQDSRMFNVLKEF